MNRNQPSRAKDGRLSRDVDERAIDQCCELKTVRLIEDHVVVASEFSRLFFGTGDHVESLLLVVGHDVVRRKYHRRMTVTIPVIGTEKNDVPASVFHSDSPKVLWRAI